MRWPTAYIKEGEQPWVTYARQRVNRNSNLNLVWLGEPGVGKSWASLAFARMYDPDWSLDFCYFKASRFMRSMAQGDFRKGQFLMLDEASVDMSASNWQNEINKGMHLVFTTMRSMNLIVSMTCPHSHFLSKGVRTLLNAKMHVLGYSKETGLTKIKARAYEFNGEVGASGKEYNKRLLFQQTGKPIQYCDYMQIPRPDQKLVKEYEKIKKEFTTDLATTIADRLERFEQKQTEGAEPRLTNHQRDVLELVRQRKNVKQIAEELGNTDRAVYQTMSEIRKKGVKIRPIYDEKGKVSGYRVGDSV